MAPQVREPCRSRAPSLGEAVSVEGAEFSLGSGEREVLHVHDVSRFVSTLLPQFMSNESYDIAMSCQREAGLDVRRRLASRYELATKAFKNDSGERHLFGYDVTPASLESLERKEPRNRRTYGMEREEARLHVKTRTGMKADDMDVVAFMKTNRQRKAEDKGNTSVRVTGGSSF